jgi:hypothetical protein
MLTDFDKKYLADEAYKHLLSFQNRGMKPTLFCFTEYKNLCNESEYISHFKGEKPAYHVFKTLNNRDYLFTNYLKLLVELGDLPIYPSKEDFVENLYLCNDDSDIRMGSTNDRARYVLVAGEFMKFTEINAYDLRNISEEKIEKEVHYCIYHKGVSRFYLRRVHSPKQLFDCSEKYMTISADAVSDEEFQELFKASNFLPENYDHSIYCKVDKMIQKMSKHGYKLDRDRPLEWYAFNSYIKNYHDDNMTIAFIEENGLRIHTEEEFKKEKEFSIGDKIEIEKKSYLIKDIEKTQAFEVAITLEEV